MPDLRRRLALLTAAFCLAGPAAALAQSAGDDQYTDPFGGSGGGQQEEPAATPEPAPAPAGEPTPAPVAAAPAEPASAPGTSTPGETAAAGSGGTELPRTGAPTGLVVALGATLLLGGLLLRRRTVGDRPSRARTSASRH
jgi:LPXTG-motif cell wall-anchored protein